MTRGGAAAARVAHNHKVAGSSPAPATKKKVSSEGWGFFLVPGQAPNLRLEFSPRKYESRTVRRSEQTRRSLLRAFVSGEGQRPLSCPRNQFRGR